jgi:ribosomal protein S18 acetylase RimI-like enzyme
MTDVSRTLHAKPLGVSKTGSAHPGQKANKQERTLGKRAGGGGEKNEKQKPDVHKLANNFPTSFSCPPQARIGGECVGAMVCKLDFHKKVVKRGYIAMLAVDSRHRKKKIGSTLVKKAIQAMLAEEADEVLRRGVGWGGVLKEIERSTLEEAC